MQMIETLNFRIRGTAPLLMHNGQLADPANKWARAIKEISSKRSKTEADYEAMARLEWMGSLYLNHKGPIIPGRVLEGSLIGKGGAARKQRMGKQAAVGLYVVRNFPLEYDGPREPEELWNDERFRSQELVVVNQSRIMRTRPIFEEWDATVSFEVDTDFVNVEDATLWMSIAGRECGLMDWRPKYGRFEVIE
jgi:hypothetical protein